MKPLTESLAAIQRNLIAPKNQVNTFAGYNYRNCEDILQAVKPLLGDLVILITDEIQQIGDRFYVKATASITDGEHTISTTAYAREALAKKGMDESQLTGATSSYARKYALNGLLLIDDNKDADRDNSKTDGVARITAAQVAELEHLIKESGSDSVKFKRWLKVADLAEIQAAGFGDAKRALEQAKAKREREAILGDLRAEEDPAKALAALDACSLPARDKAWIRTQLEQPA